MQRFQNHDWPGNVRELQNSIERAVILSQGGPIRFERTEAASRTSTAPEVSRSNVILTREELKERERASIIAALKESGGKIFGAGGAAELLEMKPTTLASRIKKLGIDKSSP